MKTKNTLVAVTGLTPQIVTETFYVLTVKKSIIIDEICIITTSRGKNIIMGKDPEFNKKRAYPILKTVLEALCKQYKIKVPKLEVIVANEMTNELHDIRNDQHNILFPNKVCEVIREKTKNNYVLHCSISGGRKTMSVDLAFALTIFGNNNDKLYHILADEKVEFNKDFWYPKNKSEDKLLELSEIPYIRLRTLISETTKNKIFSDMSYSELVDFMQMLLRKSSPDKLRFRMIQGKWEMWYANHEPVKIEPKQKNLYQQIILNKKAGTEEISVETLITLLRPKNTFENPNAAKLYDKTNIIQINSKINKKIREAVKDQYIASLFEIKHVGTYGSGKYSIEADPDKIEFLN